MKRAQHYAVPPLGLYSIGIRPISVPDLLDAAAARDVPFVHLRGGPRGYHLAGQPHDRLRCWAQHAAHTVPVTVVTTDVDLAHLAEDGTRATAITELEGLAAAAGLLARGGPTALRVLARTPVPPSEVVPGLIPLTAAPVVIELHHPDWFAEPALSLILELAGHTPGLGLLADSGQIHLAHTTLPALEETTMRRVVEHAGVVHLADSGAGLDAAGHRLLAAAVRAAARHGWAGQVAFEWTGHDRSPQSCLARYDSAASWWRQRWEGQ
ncbi:MAG: hypothetical protein ACRDRP_08620 [Pseudonocardiaceae bacterium]